MLLARNILGILSIICVGFTSIMSFYVDGVLFVGGIILANVMASVTFLGRRSSPVYVCACIGLSLLIGFILIHYTKSTGLVPPSLASLQTFLVVMSFPLLFSAPILAVGTYQKLRNKKSL